MDFESALQFVESSSLRSSRQTLTYAKMMEDYASSIEMGLGLPALRRLAPDTTVYEGEMYVQDTPVEQHGITAPVITRDMTLCISEESERERERRKAEYESKPRSSPPSDFAETVMAYYLKHIKLPQSELDAASRAAQGSEAWLRAREPVITQSKAAALLGKDPYEPHIDEALRRKVWSHLDGKSFAMKWGNVCESIAKRASIDFVKDLLLRKFPGGTIEFEEPGLVRHESQPWNAMSADLLAHIDIGERHVCVPVEYKAPSSGVGSVVHPYLKRYKSHGCLPPQYRCQILGQAGVLMRFGLEVPLSLLVTWTPQRYWVHVIPIDPAEVRA
jgi:hypothetical protein